MTSWFALLSRMPDSGDWQKWLDFDHEANFQSLLTSLPLANYRISLLDENQLKSMSTWLSFDGETLKMKFKDNLVVEGRLYKKILEPALKHQPYQRHHLSCKRDLKWRIITGPVNENGMIKKTNNNNKTSSSFLVCDMESCKNMAMNAAIVSGIL